MADDAPEYLASIDNSSFFEHFKCKTELLTYLILCVAKMPFIPPVSIARSVSGLKGKERPVNSTSSAMTVTKTKVSRGDKGSSINERLSLNLKQLGKKSQQKSHLPIAKAVSGAELHVKRGDRLLLSSKMLSDNSPVSCLSNSQSKTKHGRASDSSVKIKPEEKTRTRHEEEEARFTLTLTPEAVLLLQRRNSERCQRSVARNAGDVAGVSSSTTDSRNKKYQPATRSKQPNSKVATKNNNGDAELGDICSIVKISLLNEQYKYDDVEYEEEEDYGVDERVLVKCTEWLRGLENTPLTVGNSMNESANSMKSF